MGLVTLLTVGRSLRRLPREAHRYTLLTGTMPTFGLDSGAPVGREGEMPGEDFEVVEAQETTSETKVMNTDAGESTAACGRCRECA